MKLQMLFNQLEIELVYWILLFILVSFLVN